MKQPFIKIIQLLSDKKVYLIIILLAITGRIIQLLFYLDSFFDTTFQVIATQNFLNGNGISTAVANPGNLSAVIYQPLINWPPGYSLLLSPFYIATGHNYLMACLVLDILSATAIIFITRRILKLLEVSTALINLFTLLTAFFIYYFYYTGSTDGIAVAFFLGAVNASLALIKTRDRWLTRSITVGLCLFAGASLKYLFFPIAFVLPVFLFIYSYQNKAGLVKKTAWLSFGIVTVGIAFLYLYQKNVSGAGTYISAPGRGFFPEHLLRLHPAIPGALFTPNTVKKLPGSLAEPAMNILRVLHIIIFLVITFFAARHFIKSGLKDASLQKTFLYLSLSLSIAVSVVLILLSLLVDKELIPPDRWWTYVEDARYYGLPDILLHLSVFVLFHHYRNSVTGALKLVVIVLPFLLIPEALRGITFTANRIISAGKEKYYWQSEKDFFGTGIKIVEQLKDSSNPGKVVVTSSLYYGIYRAGLHMQAPVLENSAALNNPETLRSDEPVILLAIIRSDRLEAFKKFTEYPSTKLAGELNGFYFYTLHVDP